MKERKRVMLSISYSDYEKLMFLADRVNLLPTTYAKQLIVSNIRTIADKSGYVEGALSEYDLFKGLKFDKPKRKTFVAASIRTKGKKIKT